MSQPGPTYRPLPSAFSKQLHDEQIELQDSPTPDTTKPTEPVDVPAAQSRFRYRAEIKNAATLVAGLLILLAVMVYLSFL